MSVTKYNRDGKVVKNARRVFSGNGSSARKYTARDVIENNDVKAPTKSNLEHVVEQAAGLKVMSSVADRAAAAALVSLQETRDLVNNSVTLGKPDVRSPTQNFTDFDVDITQRNFAKRIAADVGFTDRELTNRVSAASLGLVEAGASSFLLKTKKGEARSAENSAYPEINHVLIDLDKRKGTVDAFYARITFTLPTSLVRSGDVKMVRVMRSSVTNPDLLRRVNFVSFHGLERLVADDARTHSKNAERVSSLDIRLREGNIVTALASLNPVDPSTNLRVAASSASAGMFAQRVHTPTLSADPVSADVSSFLDPVRFGGLDRSVSRDLNTMRNIRLQNPFLVPSALPPVQEHAGATNADPDVSVQQLSGSQGPRSQFIVAKNNQQSFQEVGSFSPDKLRSVTVGANGEFTQFEFDDPSIIFGRVYRYFITTVDRDMREGVRSQVVEGQTDGLRVPAFPSRVSATQLKSALSLTINVDDTLVERFEIYRKESNPGFRKSGFLTLLLINGADGFTSGARERPRVPNGFIQVGEALNGSKNTGATFYDRTVIPGVTYVYRIYSVDIFGNKSEAPNEFSFFVKNDEYKPNDLMKPNMLAEVDAFTGNIKLVFHCDDTRVRWLFLGRRDLTIFQEAFTPPAQVNTVKLGLGTEAFDASGTLQSPPSRGGFLDTVLSDRNRYVLDDRNGTSDWVGWTGVFENVISGSTFVDRSTRRDHTYQYRLNGIDVFGNPTPFELTPPTFVHTRPLVNSPVGLSASVSLDGENVTGVAVSWTDANISFSADDLVGNQTSLADSSVRSLFQVQRRRLGEERWLDFPLVSGTTFFDPVTLSGPAPGFRPPYVDVGQTYAYRVQAFQTGNLISNFTNPVDVFVDKPVGTPGDFRAQPAASKIRPYYVMLSWNTPTGSGVVDRWEIQRAEINNVFADRLNSNNPTDFANIPFAPFRHVFREASRFQSRTLDEGGSSSQPFPGEHGFMDMKIMFGNTYFYRIRAIGVEDQTSGWTFRGAKVTDGTFERLLGLTLTPAKRNLFATLPRGLNFDRGSAEPKTFKVKDTSSIVPSFSNPVLSEIEAHGGHVEVSPSPEEIQAVITSHGGNVPPPPPPLTDIQKVIASHR